MEGTIIMDPTLRTDPERTSVHLEVMDGEGEVFLEEDSSTEARVSVLVVVQAWMAQDTQ